MVESLIFIAWIAGVITQVAVTVALYHLAERRFGTGSLWAGAVFLCGILTAVFAGWIQALFVDALVFIFFGACIIFDASIQHFRETCERWRIQRIMRERRKSQESEQESPADWTRVDQHIETLLAAGRYGAAGEYANEQLRTAHEQGNVVLEKKYRAYLDRIALAMEQRDSC